MIGLHIVPVTVELKWPAKELSPNARMHHMALYRFKKAAREETYWAARAVLPPHFKWSGGKLPVSWTFHPPDNRKRDLSNCIGRVKAHEDGLAEALRMDDATFKPTYDFGEVYPRGRIVVVIGGEA